jgi:hypothetical protein
MSAFRRVNPGVPLGLDVVAIKPFGLFLNHTASFKYVQANLQ